MLACVPLLQNNNLMLLVVRLICTTLSVVVLFCCAAILDRTIQRENLACDAEFVPRATKAAQWLATGTANLQKQSNGPAEIVDCNTL